ncbi:MAG: hypothetical protein V7756_08170 [Halopseudomonas sp.]|uniref:hypothetical protein n=1 Tax=Halopseudomonas sp. TaxID=2901191 RepID=UPI0030010688
MFEGYQAAVEAYFDDFVAAFASFDGERVAAKFSLPFMAKGPGEACRVFDSRAQVAAYFQSYLDGYRSQGCRTCRYSKLTIHQVGSECLLASVTWDLLDGAGASVSSWSESYMLGSASGEVLAFATVDHVGER